jgi:hypothetical protein
MNANLCNCLYFLLSSISDNDIVIYP